MNTNLKLGNNAYRLCKYADAIYYYAKLFCSKSPIKSEISVNLYLARKKYRELRNSTSNKNVAVFSWDLAHNSAGRAYTLATLYKKIACVDIIGCLFPKFGLDVWEPIRNIDIPIKKFIVYENNYFLEEAVKFVSENPYDTVHISKQRAPSIIIGCLYKLFWDATVILDLDDEELEFAKNSNPIDIYEYLKIHGQLPDFDSFLSNDWARIAAASTDIFDDLTVCNKQLRKKYGGNIVPHVRFASDFNDQNHDRNLIRRELGISIDKKVVMFCGTPRRHKGLIETANALNKVSDSNIIFCVVGEFSDTSLRIELEKFNAVNFLFLPNIAVQKLPSILSVADCCVLMSDLDSKVTFYQSPAKLSDCLAMGVPTIVSDAPVFEDLIESKVVCVANSVNLSDKILEILYNENVNQLYRSALIAKFSELYEGDIYVDQFLNYTQISASTSNDSVQLFIKFLLRVDYIPGYKYNHKSLNKKIETDGQKTPLKIDFFKKFIVEPELVPRVNWNVNDLYGSILDSENYQIPDLFYVVPGVNKPRNTTRYRSYNLISQINKFSKAELVDYKNLPCDFYENLDSLRCVVILQRIEFNDDSEVFLNTLKTKSVLIAYDIDDQVFDQEELEPWRFKDFVAPCASYLKAMKYAEHFIVSTKTLRAKIENKFRVPCHIVPNVIGNDLLHLSEVVGNKINSESYVIGYASGSKTHDLDLNVALYGLSKFMEGKDDVIFCVIGDVNLPDWFVDIHIGKIIQLDKCDWKELPSHLSQFDLQIIPLQSVLFNQYKSHIRFLESSVVNVPVIASNVGEQSLTIINGYTGILVSEDDQKWEDALNFAYFNRQTMHDIAKNANEYVRKYWVEGTPFRDHKLSNVLGDLSLGILRDNISIVLVIYNSLSDVKNLIESIIENVRVPYELLIWLNTQDQEICDYIFNRCQSFSYIVTVRENVGKAQGANHLFRISSCRFVAGIDDDYVLPARWAEKMLIATKNIKNIGWLSTNLTRNSSGLRGTGKESTINGISYFKPSGVGGWVVFTTASAREHIGYYKEHGLYGGIDGDYNRRARSLGLFTGYVRNVIGQHKVLRDQNLAWELFKQRIQDEMRIYGKDSDLVKDKFIDFNSSENKSLKLNILISTSINHDENIWGDTHFANGLKSALEKLNYQVSITKHENWYCCSPSDIVVHLFGLHEYIPDPNRLNILWIISHVDKINRDMLLRYDFIFCSSELVLDHVKTLVPEIKTALLYQCTDKLVFYPDFDVKRDIDLLFVGNSRRIYRPAVKYAVENGFNVQVWGTKWEQFIPKKYIYGQSLETGSVASLYRRAKIVLNDHWVDQISYSLVNNRIFDALACGASVLSDFNPGIYKIFDHETVMTFKDSNDFSRLIKIKLSTMEDEAKRSTVSNSILNLHSFDCRAIEIHNAIAFLVSTYVDYKSEYLYNVRNTHSNA